MAFEYRLPKYAQIITALQERMESGEYPPGSLLPSEHQLSGEFGTARPTVVRALRELRQAGWIETEQGKGSFVRGRPALAGAEGERRGQSELDRDEAREPGSLIEAGPVPAPARVAAMLGAEPGATVISRRRVIAGEDGEASEIITWWAFPDLAAKAGLDKPEPVRGGLRAVISRAAGIRIDHVVEQIAARRATPAEAKLLGIAKSAPVLALYVSARDPGGRAVLALDVAMAGDLHELEDAYQVS
jgi:DNA-binding GntR family transcriptional regulator